ncbi:nitrous oxide reductase family maturation protein NosD [Rhodovulum strictum]|uniref:Nitrous oxide reductase family maturation protein NosD n=1 Tax=Rhodovulum strictum TaxID=58314 RepID=A0A844BNU5_9RHOB|nr:nitrous oxide reductase family maturation protein NosD [Rhodovulum strictum]MRH22603.1 nitrous oxide reductase family maturation protein NosD [Rhodovulum strictum]
MRRRVRTLALALAAAFPVGEAAAERLVPANPGALAAALAGVSAGEVLILAPGLHEGPVRLDRPVTLDGRGQAVLDAGGHGSVITVTGPDVTVRGLTIRGSGSSHQEIDAGVKLDRSATGALIEDNRILGNLVGVHVFGARDSEVRGNTIEGRRHHRMNERGNGVYVWNAPGTVVEGNDIRWGRDGIFANVSRENAFRGNLFRDLRFAVHYMYTHNSEVTGNVSLGNHLGFAVMFSNRVTVTDNLSLMDRSHGVMLNFANNADVRGNLVRGGTTEKCTFIYNAHRNLIVGNRFEGCEIGIHFTAGSERNALTGNAFIGNRTQVKYVGTRDIEWSVGERGNYWSDHPAFDLNGDGIADARFRPNDLMDHILWSQPAAALLLGSPAVQLVRWSQAAFPAILPGGVVDSHPLMHPPEIAVPPHIAALEAEARPAWLHGRLSDDDLDDLTSH